MLGGGKVNGQLSLGAVATSVVRKRMGKAPAVQSGHASPMGRCASPPCRQPNPHTVTHNLFNWATRLQKGALFRGLQDIRKMPMFAHVTTSNDLD